LEIAAYYTEIFFRDIKSLNVETPEVVAKATEHIQEMIDFVQGLVEKGYGYETSDGIYFDISKFKDYGKLSRLDLESQIAGARVEVNEEKRNPQDFALPDVRRHAAKLAQDRLGGGAGAPLLREARDLALDDVAVQIEKFQA
jgi:cysteinyl-tRNA synthetase